MQNENTIATKLGCFGMFSCYNEKIEACKECSLSNQCAKLSAEKYEKLKNIIELENN